MRDEDSGWSNASFGDPNSSEMSTTRLETEEDLGRVKLGTRNKDAALSCAPATIFLLFCIVPFPAAARRHVPPTVVVARDISIPYLGRTFIARGCHSQIRWARLINLYLLPSNPLPSNGDRHAGTVLFGGDHLGLVTCGSDRLRASLIYLFLHCVGLFRRCGFSLLILLSRDRTKLFTRSPVATT